MRDLLNDLFTEELNEAIELSEKFKNVTNKSVTEEIENNEKNLDLDSKPEK